MRDEGKEYVTILVLHIYYGIKYIVNSLSILTWLTWKACYSVHRPPRAQMVKNEDWEERMSHTHKLWRNTFCTEGCSGHACSPG